VTRRTTWLALGAVFLASLACGGAVEDDDGSLHTWTVPPPGSGHPEVTLKLVMNDRMAVIVGDTYSGEIDVPHLAEEDWGQPDLVVSDLDVDFDGVMDLRIRNDDASGAYNHAYDTYRFDPASNTYARCVALNGLHNVATQPDTRRVVATSFGNSVGSSGVQRSFASHGGCRFEELAELRWDVGLSNGRGTATCTVLGETEPVWRMDVTERPDRACPE
jgi:hypothetical protein